MALTRSKLTDFNWLLIGIFICEFSSCLSLFFSYATYLRMIGVIMALFSFIKMKKRKIASFSSVYTLFLILTIFILLRGSLIGNYFVYFENGQVVKGAYSVIRHFLIYPHSGLAFLVPFVFFIRFDLKDIGAIKFLSIICVLLSVFLIYLFYNSILSADSGTVEMDYGDGEMQLSTLMNTLCIGFGAVLLMSLCFNYLKGGIYWLIPAFVFFYFAINMIAGSRGGVVSSLLYIIIFIFFYLKYSGGNTRRHRKIVSWILLAAIIFVLIKVVIYLYNNSFFDYFLYKIERGETLEENNRTIYTKALVADFNSDPISWLIGRGVNGSYYVMGGQRTSMEWGWLWYILKGGILYLILYITILLRAFYQGFFKSNNVLCKAFGILALIQVYSLIPFGIPSVDIWCFLVWLGVGVINNSNNLLLNDIEIQQLFYKK